MTIQKRPARTSSNTIWLITFADVISLLLTFFVMMFAMSSVKIGHWREMADALSRQPRPSDAQVTSLPSAQYNIATVFRRRAINLDYLQAVVAETMAADPVTRDLPIRLAGDRLVISLPSSFASDGVRPDEQSERFLFALAGLLGNFTNPVGMVGHAGTRPQSGAAFTSNWELSVGRAAAFANTLRRAGYPGEVLVYGTAPADVPSPDEAGEADRVDVVILSGSGGV